MADDPSIHRAVPSVPSSPAEGKRAVRRTGGLKFGTASALAADSGGACAPRPRLASCACLALLAALWLLHRPAVPMVCPPSTLHTDPCLPPLMQLSCDADPHKLLCFGKAWASGAPELRRDAHVSPAYSLRVGG